MGLTAFASRTVAVVLLLYSAAFAASEPVVRVPSQQRIDDAGVQLELQWTSPAGEAVISPERDLLLSLRVSDRASGQPLGGLKPMVWASHVSSAVAAAETCPDRIKRLAAGRLSARADVDLNGFRLLTLNGDRSLSVLDPQMRVGSTRLESLITLPADAADWALLPQREWVAVTLPQARQVALIDLHARRIVALVDTGPYGEPRRIAHEAGSDRLWVALDGAAELLAIDAAQSRVSARVAIGDGYHALAFGADARTLLVTSSRSGEVAVVDTAEARVRHRVSVGPGTVAVTYSSASGHGYAAAAGSNRIVAFDLVNGRTVHDINAAQGVIALRTEPAGRHVFAISEIESRAWVIDSADGRVVGSAAVADHPDQVVFTRRFAYIRGLNSIKVSLIDLAALQRGAVEVTDVPMFRATAASQAQQINVADMIVPSPDGAGAIIAGTADTALYSYMEGMMAPQGTFDTAKRTPRALMLVDRTLRETTPGTYSQRVRFSRPGRYVVPVFIGQPRVTQCVELIVDGAVPQGERHRLATDLVDASRRFTPGRTERLQFRVARDDAGAPVTGLTDLQVMVLELPGIWQQRQFAREIAPGLYEIEQRFPRGGQYRVSLQIASQGLAFGATGTTTLRVHADTRTAETTP